MTPSSSYRSSSLSTRESTKVRSVCNLIYQSMSALFHLGKPTTSGSLEIECFQLSLEMSGELYFSSCCITFPSLSKFLAKHIRSIQTSILVAPCWIGGSLAFHSSQHVRTHSLLVSYNKRSCERCPIRPGSVGSAIAVFYPLSAQRHMLQTRVLFLSLSGSGGGDSSAYSKGLQLMLERIGLLLCLSSPLHISILIHWMSDFCYSFWRVGLQALLLLILNLLEELVTANGHSDLTLLWIDLSAPYLQHHTTIFVPVSCGNSGLTWSSSTSKYYWISLQC